MYLTHKYFIFFINQKYIFFKQFLIYLKNNQQTHIKIFMKNCKKRHEDICQNFLYFLNIYSNYILFISKIYNFVQE